MQPEEVSEQLAPELISTGTQATVENAKRLGLTWTLTPATVTSTDPLQAIMDGDTVPIGIVSMLGPLPTGIRAYVIQVPPSGNFVIGLPNGLVDLQYPIGAVYMSLVETDPGTLFGGTWEALEDRFLIGASGTFPADSTGGATTHVHTQADISSSGAHTHDIPQGTDSTSNVQVNALGVTVSNSTHDHDDIASSGNHTHVTPSTDSASSFPSYRAVYMWKRVA